MEKIIYWPCFILLSFFLYHIMPEDKKHGRKRKDVVTDDTVPGNLEPVDVKAVRKNCVLLIQKIYRDSRAVCIAVPDDG